MCQWQASSKQPIASGIGMFTGNSLDLGSNEVSVAPSTGVRRMASSSSSL